ncbi:hypothetical protein TREES_T100015957 [Tupaia chinensis]|uniref:Uncharacterized protein n=1 Tax=Tupaia chinensis TaxID=246437 RepID=L9KS06_TUPCH|nr:hypothetical protein TREES_T100015957 [Tupaia chinensis]
MCPLPMGFVRDQVSLQISILTISSLRGHGHLASTAPSSSSAVIPGNFSILWKTRAVTCAPAYTDVYFCFALATHTLELSITQSHPILKV